MFNYNGKGNERLNDTIKGRHNCIREKQIKHQL